VTGENLTRFWGAVAYLGLRSERVKCRAKCLSKVYFFRLRGNFFKRSNDLQLLLLN